MPRTDQVSSSRPDCFLRQVKQVCKKFPNSKRHIEEFLDELERAPFASGDRMPGFGELHLRKARTGLPEYRIGKSGGLRVIYLAFADDGSVIFVAVYHKGDGLSEADVVAIVKANLQELLSET